MTSNFSIRAKWTASVLASALASSGLCGLPAALARGEHLIWPSEIEQVVDDLNSPDRQTRRNAQANLPRLPPPTLQRVMPELLDSRHRSTRLAAAALCWTVSSHDTAERLTAWLSDPDPEFRLAAATHFNTSPYAPSLSGLVRALRDSEQGIQIAAATALGTLGDPSAVPGLVAALRSRRGDVREAAATALGWLANPSATAALLELTTDEVPSVQVAALRSLGLLRTPSAVARIASALQDRDAQVQQAAIAALGALGVAEVVPVLERELTKSQTSTRAEVVMAALAAVGTPEALNAIVQQLHGRSDIRELAIAVLQRGGAGSTLQLKLCLQSQRDAAIRAGCLRALPEGANPDLADLVEASLRSGQSKAVDALTALGRVGSTSNLPTVLQWVSSPDPMARRASLVATQTLLQRSGGWGPAVDPIDNALSSATGLNEPVVLLRLLGLTRSPRAQTTLLRYVASTHSSVQQVALKALAALPIPLDSETVVAQLDSVHPQVAWQAAATLRLVGGPGALKMLLARVQDWNSPDIPLTQLALSGPIARFAETTERQWLREQLRDARGSARSTLLEALGLSEHPDTTALLTAAAWDPAAPARAKVAELLAFGGADGADSLRSLLNDTDSAVRANAAWALGQIGSESDFEVVEQHLDDNCWPVAANAAGAAAKLLVIQKEEGGVADQTRLARLCSLVDSPVPHAAANALLGLRQLQDPCAKPSARWLLGHSASSTLRLAAASYLTSLPVDANPASDRHQFRLCQERDLDGSVAQICSRHLHQFEQATAGLPSEHEATATPASSSTRRDAANRDTKGARAARAMVFFNEHEPAVTHPFALRLSDGWIRNGWTDERGAVLVPASSSGATSPSQQDAVLAPVFLDEN